MNIRPDSRIQDVLDSTPVEKGKEVELIGTCASFCDPNNYPSKRELDALPDNMVVALGFHPKHSKNELDRCWPKIVKLLSHPNVTAVGEVGLDHSEGPERWHHQMETLSKFLTLVDVQKVLILHC